MQERPADLHELRARVSARDKALCGTKPFPEAVKYMRECYRLDEDSAAAFVSWQKTIASGGVEGTKSNPQEKWHLKFDADCGKWVKVPQPGEPGYLDSESQK